MLTSTESEAEAEQDTEADRARVLESELATAVRPKGEALSQAARAEDQKAAFLAERGRLATQVAALIERIPASAEGE